MATNLKKVIVQLENGLVITFAKLSLKKTSETFKRYLSLFNPLESRTTANHIYVATFNCKRAKFQALCFDFSVPLDAVARDLSPYVAQLLKS